jgi:hypothetical protein
MWMGLCEASDIDLLHCYQSLEKLNENFEKLRASLKELEEAAMPITRLLVPHVAGEQLRPLVDSLNKRPRAW